MDDQTRQRYKSIVAEDIRRHRPDNADKAEMIVDHLFTMPQLQDETSVLIFIDEYRKAVAKGVGRELS